MGDFGSGEGHGDLSITRLIVVLDCFGLGFPNVGNLFSTPGRGLFTQPNNRMKSQQSAFVLLEVSNYFAAVLKTSCSLHRTSLLPTPLQKIRRTSRAACFHFNI